MISPKFFPEDAEAIMALITPLIVEEARRNARPGARVFRVVLEQVPRSDQMAPSGQENQDYEEYDVE